MATKTLKIDDYEQGMLLQALIDLRNKQLAQGKSGDCISELILKVEHAKTKGLFGHER